MLEDTPDLAVRYCPACEPDRNPLAEILVVRYCVRHEPPLYGTADAGVAHSFISGSEAGGEDNRRLCDLLHRGVIA